MTQKNIKISKNIKLFGIIFIAFFIVCFIFGFFRAIEVGKKILKNEQWIESYVSENTKILMENGVYKILFQHPKNEISFLYNLDTKTIHEFDNLDSNIQLDKTTSGMLNSQTVELSIGIISSTVLAAHKDALKAMYIKKPRSGIGAIITAITASLSGYWFGYKLGMPNLIPDAYVLKKFLNKSENWKKIIKESLYTIILLPNYKNIAENIEKKIKEKGIMQITPHGKINLENIDPFIELEQFSKYISRTDYEISNKDFYKGFEISKKIVEIDPKNEIDAKFEIVKEILMYPTILVEFNDAYIEYRIIKEMKEKKISRDAVLKLRKQRFLDNYNWNSYKEDDNKKK